MTKISLEMKTGISEQINEPENEELVINESSKNTEQDKQEEEILDVFIK